MKFAAVAVLAGGQIFAQAAPSEADTMKAVEQLVRSHISWGPSLNWTGASLELREVSRAGGGITYRLRASGLPRDKIYTAVQWPVTVAGPTLLLDGITLDENGLAICAGTPGTCGSPEKPNDPIQFTMRPARGEPFRIAVTAQKEPQVRAFFTLVAVPNEGRDQGCRVQAVRLSAKGEVVLIEAAGFAPGAEVTFESDSSGEKVTQKVKASADGVYYNALLPFVKGKNGGTTQVRLRSSACAPTVSFHWGE